MANSYDFNKIKKDLESVRLRHEEAQLAKTNNYFIDGPVRESKKKI